MCGTCSGWPWSLPRPSTRWPPDRPPGRQAGPRPVQVRGPARVCPGAVSLIRSTWAGPCAVLRPGDPANGPVHGRCVGDLPPRGREAQRGRSGGPPPTSAATAPASCPSPTRPRSAPSFPAADGTCPECSICDQLPRMITTEIKPRSDRTAGVVMAQPALIRRSRLLWRIGSS